MFHVDHRIYYLQSGLTPIHVAAFMGHENIVHALTHHGASPNTTNVVSRLILMYYMSIQIRKSPFCQQPLYLPARRDSSPHGSQGRPGRRSPIPAKERSQGGDQVQG